LKTESKYAVAKKVLKKQLKVNTKVIFDDDGLVRYANFFSFATLEFCNYFTFCWSISWLYLCVFTLLKFILSVAVMSRVCVNIQGGPKKSKPPPIFQKIALKIANEIRFRRKVKVW